MLGNGCRKMMNKKKKKKAKQLTQLEVQQQKVEEENLIVHWEKEEKIKQEAIITEKWFCSCGAFVTRKKLTTIIFELKSVEIRFNQGNAKIFIEESSIGCSVF